MHADVVSLLRERDIQPSAQRVAIAEYVLETTSHPSADQVWERVKSRIPMVSRATVYNTLNLFVSHGLLRELVLAEGRIVFDPRIEPHHHMVDVETGEIHDIAWDKLEVKGVDQLANLDVHEHQVVLRGRIRRGKSKS
ncbi:MAG: transcriptional repressor [Planctomycetota bacterium]|nr:MAG: transcriptional repressor [Planctomycetota bacterium]